MPTRYGGMGTNVAEIDEEAKAQKKKCEMVTQDLKEKVLTQDPSLPIKCDLTNYTKVREKQLRE